MVRAGSGSQWPEVSVNPKENRLFRTDGSYLLALLYSWPVWYQPNHRVLTKGVWQPLRIVELNPKVTNNVWIPPWASHCWKSMCVGSRSRCSVEWHHDRWNQKQQRSFNFIVKLLQVMNFIIWQKCYKLLPKYCMHSVFRKQWVIFILNTVPSIIIYVHVSRLSKKTICPQARKYYKDQIW